MADRSKEHHFVPQTMQEAFCDQSSRLWYSERDRNGNFKKPEPRRPKTVFKGRNYYTVLDENDKYSDLVEREHYGKIDNYLGEFLKDVLNAFDNNLVPVFTGDALTSIQIVVYEMIKRTPEFTKDLDDIGLGREVAKTIFSNADVISERKEQYRDPHFVKAVGRDIRVRATLTVSDEIKNALSELQVRWAISQSRHSYILSSLVAYRIGNGGPNGLSNPNMEIWMPISPKICLVLLRDPKSEIPLKVVDTRDRIRDVNLYAMRNSNQIASHSEVLLNSLINHR